MITGAAQMDGAILVVSALDGRCRRRGARAARASGRRASRSSCALNKCDAVDDPEMLDLVEMEVRELLNKYKFDGDDAKVVRVAALPALNGDAKWEQSIGDLVDGARRARSRSRFATSTSRS